MPDIFCGRVQTASVLESSAKITIYRDYSVSPENSIIPTEPNTELRMILKIISDALSRSCTRGYEPKGGLGLKRLYSNVLLK